MKSNALLMLAAGSNRRNSLGMQSSSIVLRGKMRAQCAACLRGLELSQPDCLFIKSHLFTFKVFQRVDLIFRSNPN